jgi:hypothetical protein
MYSIGTLEREILLGIPHTITPPTQVEQANQGQYKQFDLKNNCLLQNKLTFQKCTFSKENMSFSGL